MKRLIARLLEPLVRMKRSDMTGLTVVSTKRLTPHMLRVSFACRNLQKFADPSNIHVRLVLPPKDASRSKWLNLSKDGLAIFRDKNTEIIHRKYTIRSIDMVGGQLDIDFVLHGDSGPGSAWAERAEIGDVVGMIGPGGRSATTADWLLLAGDETALPAIGRILDDLPANVKGEVLVEVDAPQDQQPLNISNQFRLRWLHRNGVPAGTSGLIRQALDEVKWPQPDQGRQFVWIAGEAEEISIIRKHLRSHRKLTKEQLLAVAYWRRSDAISAEDKR
jgi:NADPH-dependent ferric siderophore reductase